MWLTTDRAAELSRRRRFIAGPVGCGLCGIDSLDEALRPLPTVRGAGPVLAAADVNDAMTALTEWQPLHDLTHAVHAAAFFRPGEGSSAAREDVGRHNALDKLVGALALGGSDAADGAILITSRISVEMVQKSVLAGRDDRDRGLRPHRPRRAARRGRRPHAGRIGAGWRVRGVHARPTNLRRRRRALRRRLTGWTIPPTDLRLVSDVAVS